MTPAEIKKQMAFDWVAFVGEYEITGVDKPAKNLRNHLNSLLFSGLSVAKLKRLSARKFEKIKA